MLNSLSLPTKEKIAALEEVNRPLDIHWNVKAKFGLNARESDTRYKHHISNLEEIYCKEREGPAPPPHMLVTTPVSDLYGCQGLLTTLPGIEDKKKQRELNWIDNHQKFAYLTDPTMVDRNFSDELQQHQLMQYSSRSRSPLRQTAAAAASPAKVAGMGKAKRATTAPATVGSAGRSGGRLGGSNGAEDMNIAMKMGSSHHGRTDTNGYDSDHRPLSTAAAETGGGGTGAAKIRPSSASRMRATATAPATFSSADSADAPLGTSMQPPHVNKRTSNTELSEEDMVMLGVYRLDARQAEIYQNFVNMLTEFDSHDSRNIVEDAMNEAQNEDLLQYYGGTETPAD